MDTMNDVRELFDAGSGIRVFRLADRNGQPVEVEAGMKNREFFIRSGSYYYSDASSREVLACLAAFLNPDPEGDYYRSRPTGPGGVASNWGPGD